MTVRISLLGAGMWRLAAAGCTLAFLAVYAPGMTQRKDSSQRENANEGMFKTEVSREVHLTSEPIAIAWQAKAGDRFTALVSLDPGKLTGSNAHAQVLVSLPGIGSKTLHQGDPDLMVPLRAQSKRSVIELAPKGVMQPGVKVKLSVVRWLSAQDSGSVVSFEPNGRTEQSTPFTLGEPVFGSGDLTPYIPIAPSEVTSYYDASRSEHALSADSRTDGDQDWLRFDLPGNTPKLVMFELDLPERDNLPPDVSIFSIKDGKPVPVLSGIDPNTPPHEVQSLPGNKFTTRVLEPGRYFVRIIANHPEWVLRTRVLEVPRYKDPRQAVRTGIDYLAGAGDSWHANTPRAGGKLHRIANVHAETAQCIACHPTHFSTRGILTALANGYRTERTESLRFLTERLANNPRPFYGHPKATWARMISAAANVTARAADLVSTASELTRESPASNSHVGAVEYLKLYYKGRTTLPEDESNGNVPLVSQYEVLYHAYRVMKREALRPSSDVNAKAICVQLEGLASQDRHKDLIALCWQSVLLAEINRADQKPLRDRNTALLFSLQRANGAWSMPMKQDQAADCEYQTAHALYALARCGYTASDPRIQRGVEYLLSKQQPFGGWFQQEQPFENFRTPFRETQFAVMALSQLYPEDKSPPKATIVNRNTPTGLLAYLDDIARGEREPLLKHLLPCTESPDPLIRAHAARALSRAEGSRATAAALTGLLHDRSKSVQRLAAVALRDYATRAKLDLTVRWDQCLTDFRGKWAATRIFAYHFREVANQPELLDRLIALASDPSPTVRVGALQAVWQWFQWAPPGDQRARITKSVLHTLAKDEHPWVVRNAGEALYNIADENVRYLYNNWVPLLGTEADRVTATQGQHAQDLQTASLIADSLKRGTSRARLRILKALVDFHLRIVRGGSNRYGRVGNDVEQIRFAPVAADILEPELLRAIADSDPQVRRYAALAAPMIREAGPRDLVSELIRGLADPDPSVRAACLEMQRTLPIATSGPLRTRTVNAVSNLLSSSDNTVIDSAAALLSSPFGKLLLSESEIKAHAEERIRSAPSSLAGLMLLSLYPEPLRELGIQHAIIDALGSPETLAAEAAVKLALTSPGLSGSDQVLSRIEALASANPKDMRSKLLATARFSSVSHASAQVAGAVADSILSQSENERKTALGLAEGSVTLRQSPSVRAALQSLASSSDLASKQASRILSLSVTRMRKQPDREYFAQFVMPLLAVKSASDGNGCVSCHFNHNLFRASQPNSTGNFSPGQIDEAYLSALKVVNLDSPETSLLLRKPLSNAAIEGVVGAQGTSHGGGPRWSGPEDPGYRTVLAWIRGAATTSSPSNP